MLDAFFTSLVLLALSETGGRVQLLCAALAIRFDAERRVIAALFGAGFLNCLISAMAGAQLPHWISDDARTLFTALAFGFGGLSMIGWRRRVDSLAGWRTGPFLTGFLGLFVLMFGDSGQFLLAANAARTDSPLMAAAGGVAGIAAACVPAVILRERLAELLPLSTLRRIGGSGFLIVATYLALSAFRLL